MFPEQQAPPSVVLRILRSLPGGRVQRRGWGSLPAPARSRIAHLRARRAPAMPSQDMNALAHRRRRARPPGVPMSRLIFGLRSDRASDIAPPIAAKSRRARYRNRRRSDRDLWPAEKDHGRYRHRRWQLCSNATSRADRRPRRRGSQGPSALALPRCHKPR